MNRFFSDSALIQLRDAIADAGGNEVFFLGRTDSARVVIEAEPLARGNRDAVAAILSVASFGDVVIHNHPSGELTPSRPDIEIASILGNQGVGFYIIDNGATRCYQAVSAFARRETALLSFQEIEKFFGATGELATHLEEFEHRDEQVRMAFSAAQAFNEDKVAVIEAGTGTGKSVAYLVPAVWWGVRNRDRVVVSTNTINLQEQLVKKDIPLLRQAMGLDFRAVLVKGRSNYLCRRKLEGVKAEPTLFPDEAQGELQAILEWGAKTNEGCRSDLSFIPKDDIWEEVACEADQCARIKCPNYSRCFFYTARREAAGADVLVVNHALLMADLALRSETGYGGTAVLPPFNRLIVDEAHHLEDVATSHLSAAVSRNSLLKLLGKLQNPRKQERGLLPRLSAGLAKEMPDELDALFHELSGLVETVLIPSVTELHDEVTKRLDRVGVALLAHLKLGEREKGEQKLRVTASLLTTPFWHGAEEEIKALAGSLSKYVSRMREFMKGAEKLPEKVLEKLANVLIDIKGVPARIESAVSALHDFTNRDDTLCRWFEVRRGPKGMTVRFCSSPLEVSAALKNVLFNRFKTIILTSATLAVGDKFDFLEERTGISLLNRARVTELLLPSPFDYAHQAFVGIPSTIPEPGAPGFERALEECLLKALFLSGGRAFVLFTSYDLLRRMHGRLFEPLKRWGMTVLKQGEMNRHLLLSRFRQSPNPVLFGTDSFWEGVDVKGRGLELVIMARLPFRVPTEPILEARAEHIERNGGDSFRDYAVPQAVIKFKQGFGRLIRSRDDRGGVLVLDSRVLTKSYGRKFLKSLPEVSLNTGTEAEVLKGLGDFFSASPASPASPQS